MEQSSVRNVKDCSEVTCQRVSQTGSRSVKGLGCEQRGGSGRARI